MGSIAQDISTLPPTWNHPVLPGNAVQGMVLLTKNDFSEPPQSTEDLMWCLMENVLGVHDIKLEWDEDENIYTIKKSVGHMDNEGNWTEEWTTIGTITGLSEEAEEKIQQLVYASYQFETTSTSLKVIATKMDGTEETLCDITFATQAFIYTITGQLSDLTTTAKDNLVAAINELVTENAALEARVAELETKMATKKTLTVVLADGTTETITYIDGN